MNKDFVHSVVDLAEQAGKLIMEYYHSGFDVIKKPDNSPVTTADLAANKLIVNELANLTPDIEIISEEDYNPSISIKGDSYWLVDPLDGTRNFIEKNTNFAVSIGLVSAGQPIFGVIYQPYHKKLYYTENNNAYRKINGGRAELISSAYNPVNGVDVVTSKSGDSQAIKNFLTDYKVKNHFIISSAVKLCMIAEGTANIYPCFTKTMHWDTAGGHAILRAAKGEIFHIDKKETLSYDKSSIQNPYFLAAGLAL